MTDIITYIHTYIHTEISIDQTNTRSAQAPLELITIVAMGARDAFLIPLRSFIYGIMAHLRVQSSALITGSRLPHKVRTPGSWLALSLQGFSTHACRHYSSSSLKVFIHALG